MRNVRSHKSGNTFSPLRIISKISKWVAHKAAYRAGIRDEVRNRPLRQYRDPSLQIVYMFGRVEVREDHRLRGSD